MAFLLIMGGGAVTFVHFSGRDDKTPVDFEVVRLSEAPSTTLLDASGYVVARRQATVAAKITARVIETPIEEGQYVSVGQIMARLDDSNAQAALKQAEAQLRQAEANFEAARIALADQVPIFKRQLDLNAKGWVASAALDNERAKYDSIDSSVKNSDRALEVAKAALVVAQRNEEDTVVRAPFSGVVTVKAAQPGEVVSPLSAGGGFTRTGIGTLVDMNSLEVEVDVGESFIDRIRPNGDALVRLNAYPEQPVPAYVVAIVPTADRSKSTVKVRVGFRDKSDRILPEMGARVSFLAPPKEPAKGELMVPAAAITGGKDDAAVFVIHGSKVERRAVKLAGTAAGVRVVSEGVVPGEVVAVGDLGKLVDGMAVRRRDD